MPWVFLGCPASLTYLPPDDESASGVSSHSSDGCRSVRTLRKRHVRALLGLREDVGRGSVQLSDHSPTRREEDPYLAPEEKKRRLTNLEAMAETRRQQLLDNCVETIDLTTANYQPTFRTASSNQTRGPHLPLQRPPCVSHLPAVWAAAAAGPKRRKPASQQNASSSSSSPSVVRDGALAENFMQTVVSTSTSSPSAVLDSTLRILATSTSDLSTLISQVSRNYRGCSVHMQGWPIRTWRRSPPLWREPQLQESTRRLRCLDKLQPTAVSPDPCWPVTLLAVGCLARMVAPLNSDI